MTLKILLVLIVLLYLKWISIFMIYPFQACAAYSQKHPDAGLFKLLSLPYRAVQRFTRSGWEKFSVTHIGRLPSYHLRKWLYQGLGADLAPMVIFRYPTEIWSAHKLKAGRGMIGGYNMLLDARNGIEIGDNVNFSANVQIYTEQHDYRAADFSCDNSINKKVVIGDRVWVGPNVIILPGVTVGDGAVLAAGCVVTRDVEPYTVVGGVPAKKVADRPRNLIYEFNGKGSRIY